MGNLTRSMSGSCACRGADVFTTNWDTLLEKASRRVFDRTYDPVLCSADLATTVAPRIVKLHGSFPSSRPFVVTEEDYRTYPIRFAPLVNTVQQALMESIFLLVGFSGTTLISSTGVVGSGTTSDRQRHGFTLRASWIWIGRAG